MQVKRWLAAALLTALPGTGLAHTCTATITGVAFGIYSRFDNAAKDISGNIQVQCSGALLPGVTLLVNYTISIGPGGGGSIAGRRMAGSRGGALRYQLHQTAPGGPIWGDGSGGSSVGSGSWLLGVLAPAQNWPIFARLPAGQNPPSGTYLDTAMVTISY